MKRIFAAICCFLFGFYTEDAVSLTVVSLRTSDCTESNYSTVLATLSGQVGSCGGTYTTKEYLAYHSPGSSDSVFNDGTGIFNGNGFDSGYGTCAVFCHSGIASYDCATGSISNGIKFAYISGGNFVCYTSCNYNNYKSGDSCLPCSDCTGTGASCYSNGGTATSCSCSCSGSGSDTYGSYSYSNGSGSCP
jgi:hypothetical protein